MLETWWREITGAVAGTLALGLTVKKFWTSPSKIDRELCALRATIDGMNTDQGVKLDEIAGFILRAEARFQLIDERYELTNQRIERLEHRQ